MIAFLGHYTDCDGLVGVFAGLRYVLLGVRRWSLHLIIVRDRNLID